MCVAVVIDGLAWRPLPLHAPERLIGLQVTDGDKRAGLSVPEYEGLIRNQQVLSGTMSWVDGLVLNVEAQGRLQLANVWAVSDDFFGTLVEAPLRGRLVVPAAAPTHEVGGAVISYDVWQRRFDGRADIIGQQVRVEGLAFSIVGVTGPRYTRLTRGVTPALTLRLADLEQLAPHAGLPERLTSDASWTGLGVGGRLADGISHASACAALNAAWVRIRREGGRPAPPGAPGAGSQLACTPIGRGINAEQLQTLTRPLWIVLLLAGLLLLVGVLHVAELFLLTIAARRPEVALRLAHGAPRSAVLLHVFTLVASVTGIAVALGAAAAVLVGPRLAVAFLDRGFIVPAVDATTNARTVLWISAIATCTVLLCAAPVLWSVARLRPDEMVPFASPRTTQTLRWQTKLLMGAQVAIAVPLLLVAATLAGAVRVWTYAVGDRGVGLSVARLYPQPQGYAGMDGPTYYPRLLSNVHSIPGVQHAALSNHEPGGTYVHERRVQRMDGTVSRVAGVVVASPGLFATLGAPPLQGRDFSWADTRDTERAVVVSRRLAEALFPATSPLGQQVYLGAGTQDPPARIIGVAPDFDVFDVRDIGRPLAYTAWLQEPDYTPWAALVLVRHRLSDQHFGAQLASAVASLRHEYVLWSGPSAAVTRRALASERFAAAAAALLSSLSSVLLALGVFAAIAHLVARQRRRSASDWLSEPARATCTPTPSG